MKTTFTSLLPLVLVGSFLLPVSFADATPVPAASIATASADWRPFLNSDQRKARKAYQNRIKRGKRGSMSRAMARKYNRGAW